MARKDKLEQYIRDTDSLINGYREILISSSRPEEDLRSQNMIEAKGKVLGDLLEQYLTVSSYTSSELPQDILEIAAGLKGMESRVEQLIAAKPSTSLLIDTKEMDALRQRIATLENVLVEARDFLPKDQDDTTPEKSDANIITFALTDGSKVRCKSEVFSQAEDTNIHETIDGRHLVKIFVNPEPWRRQALHSLMRLSPRHDDPSSEQVLCWPDGLVVAPKLGIRIPLVPQGLRPLTWFLSQRVRFLLPKEERGDWLGHLRIATNIARATRNLHMSGLCHSDLSPSNILADTRTGTAVLLHLDTLVLPGVIPPTVLGTPGYMAPEIVEGEGMPSVLTDLHSLAVLVYQTLLLRHPLIGPKIHSLVSIEEDEHLNFGSNALFIEHPTDDSNRPETFMIGIACLGNVVADLFHRAFVVGLDRPERRPAAAEWESALMDLASQLEKCSNPDCAFGYYVANASQTRSCPWCDEALHRGALSASGTKSRTSISGRTGRRRPIYFLVDCACPPGHERMDKWVRAIDEICRDFRTDPGALESVWISVIACGKEANQVIPLSELISFRVPTLLNSMGPPLNFSKAFEFLLGIIELEVSKPSLAEKGDYTPIIILFVGERPSDSWETSARSLLEPHRRCDFIVFACSDSIDADQFSLLTEKVMLIDTMSATEIPDFVRSRMRWRSMSIKVGTRTPSHTDLKELPLPPSKIEIVP